MSRTFSSQGLRSAREASGFSRQAAASWAGIATSTLKLYEDGERVPRMDVLLLLAQLYGAPLDKFEEPTEAAR